MFIPWLPLQRYEAAITLHTDILYTVAYIYTVLQCTDMQHQRMLPSYPVEWVDNDGDHGMDGMGMMNGDAGSNGTKTDCWHDGQTALYNILHTTATQGRFQPPTSNQQFGSDNIQVLRLFPP